MSITLGWVTAFIMRILTGAREAVVEFIGDILGNAQGLAISCLSTLGAVMVLMYVFPMIPLAWALLAACTIVYILSL